MAIPDSSIRKWAKEALLYITESGVPIEDLIEKERRELEPKFRNLEKISVKKR